MNPIRLEAKRFLYSIWMLPAVLLVTSCLAWFVYRAGVFPQQREQIYCLTLLLGSVEYHILLYAVLALALVGVDVSARIPQLETLAGGSPLRFLRRKAILYVAAVLVCELLYIAIPLLLWGIFPDSIWRLLPARLFLDLGIAMPFFLLQAALPSLQAMLVGDSLAAILWIGLHEDDMNTWYMAAAGNQGLPSRWILLAALSIAASLVIGSGLFMRYPLLHWKNRQKLLWDQFCERKIENGITRIQEEALCRRNGKHTESILKKNGAVGAHADDQESNG